MDAKVDVSEVVLESERLILRSWKPEDLEDLYSYASIPGVGERAGWPHHKNREESKQILNLFIQDKKTFALKLKENGRVIGSLGLEHEKLLPKEYAPLIGREVGFVLSKDYWGKGLMPEALRRVIAYCFDECGYDFLSCGHFLDNAQSARVQKKCGFKPLCTIEYKTQTGELVKSQLNVLLNEKKETAWKTLRKG